MRRHRIAAHPASIPLAKHSQIEHNFISILMIRGRGPFCGASVRSGRRAARLDRGARP
ncbi:hypothetical protein DM49_1485 [Burkholderia mallei]|nr:hypothetical protein DM53_3466 [Burkholderia mallei]KOS94991.1 hypothetical protein DM49_1485 [Burkholderia mallei]